MSDSFETQTNPYSFLDGLHKYSLQIVRPARYPLPAGWAGIVKTLADTLRKESIYIELVEHFGELSIRSIGEPKIDNTKLKILKAVYVANEASKTTCAKCGSCDGTRRIVGNKIKTLCNQCFSAAKETGSTGTWLDRY